MNYLPTEERREKHFIGCMRFLCSVKVRSKVRLVIGARERVLISSQKGVLALTEVMDGAYTTQTPWTRNVNE